MVNYRDDGGFSAGHDAGEEVLGDEEWYGHPDVQTIYKGADVNHSVCWMHFGPQAGMTISVRLFRPWKDAQSFTRRDVALLDLAGSDLPRLYQAEMGVNCAAGDLSPRATQTLRLLQRGHSEKEIAGLLGLSPHTVHDYIKGIYRHYKVGSRRELLAKFIG